MPDRKRLAVAIVGSGPSGMYLAEALSQQFDYAFEIDIFDRLPTPYGLVRNGVAPDHPEKKLVADRLFDVVMKQDNVRFFGNVEIGKDVTVDTLRQRYCGVFFAHGMNQGKVLGIPGEELTNVWTSHDFVAWYNGHPDYSDKTPDLSKDRAVIIGNGNVALDIARLLVTPEPALKRTDMADHAVKALGGTGIREVVILGRKDPARAAFNNPELEEFEHCSDVDVNVLPDGMLDNTTEGSQDFTTARKLATLKRLAAQTGSEASRRITFSFLTTPQRILGDETVQGVEVEMASPVNDEDPITKTIEAGLVVTAIGYRGAPLVGLPFNEDAGTVPNKDGRVQDASGIMDGVYVTGWARRGPSGVIGTNKMCARQVVENFLSDLEAERVFSGSPPNPIKTSELSRAVDRAAWFRIDRHERLSGQKSGTPRKKLVNVDEILQIADV